MVHEPHSSPEKPQQSAMESQVKLAAEMIRHEHQRWNQWALGFFGAIVTIFAGWDQLRDEFPLWIAFGLATIVNIFWILASLGIRKSTTPWWKTANEIAEVEPSDVFAIFDKHSKDFKWPDALLHCLFFWRKDEHKRTTTDSVTANIIRLSMLSALLFFMLTVHFFLPWFSEKWWGSTTAIIASTSWAIFLGICTVISTALAASHWWDKRQLKSKVKKLATFMKEGQELYARRNQDPQPIEEHNEWVEQVEEYLRTNLGPSYATRFGNFHGMTFYTQSQFAKSLEGRLARLHEFLSELGGQ